MTRTAGAQIGCQRLSRFWGLGCPKIYHEAEDTLVLCIAIIVLCNTRQFVVPWRYTRTFMAPPCPPRY
ncbi:hypothetical protein [Thiolapillus sp.]|uniref:hypothetical protein n=1 Tax=Thiolapillus sp. TaxID=2017437 RepID=UPI003AF965E2